MIESKSRKSTRDPLAVKVAKSFTVEDIKLLGSIHPRELIDRRWKSKHKSKLAPNALRAIGAFNKRVNWVISTLLSVKPGKVQTAVKFFLALADKLLKLHNFNGFMQVAYGLYTPWLKKGRWKAECETLRPKHRSKWKFFCKVAKISNHGFREYRSLVRSVLAGDRSKCTRRIPCWNIFLSDISHIESSMKWLVDKGKAVEQRRINISKSLQLYKCMQTHLYRGTMGGYGDIESNQAFDHKVQQSLAVTLSDKEIKRLVQHEIKSAAATDKV